MKLIFSAALAVMLLLFSAGTKAGAVSYGTVDIIQFWVGHPGALIKIATMSDPEGCGRQDYYILQDTHAHSKQIYALMLAANASGQKVQVWTDGCFWGFPNIVNAMILR